MALNPPPLKLYDYANFALDNINEFAKGQGYAVSKFRLKTDKRGRGRGRERRGRAQRQGAEAVAAKPVQVLLHRSLRNPLNRLESK